MTMALDRRQRLVLVALVVGYFVILGLVFFLLPIVGSQVVIEVVGLWIVVMMAVLVFGPRLMKRPKAQTKT